MEEINPEIMRFYAPAWLFLLILLPGLLLVFQAAMRNKALALGQLVSQSHFHSLVQRPHKSLETIQTVLFFAGLAFLILALARPQFGQGQEPMERKGLDILIMLDASLSMKVKDEVPDRFQRAKEGVKELLSQLEGDRVGLVLFSNTPLRIIPFTTDYGALESYLELVDPSIFVQTGTNIHSSLSASIPFLEKGSKKDRVILVISDGEDETDLEHTMTLNHKMSGTRVFSFGVGTQKGGPVPVRMREGKVEWKKDSNGLLVQSVLSKEALETISERYGGKYYPLNPSSTKQFVGELDNMKKALLEAKTVYRYQDYFQVFLLIGFLFLFAGKFFNHKKREQKFF